MLSSFVKYIVNNVITLYDSDCAILYLTRRNKMVNTVFKTLFILQFDSTGYAWLC